MKNNKVIALVGCGIWGKKILRTLTQLGCDVMVLEQSKALAQDARELGARDFLVCTNDNLNKQLAQFKLDGIVIASPSTTHKDVTLELLGLNVPLFIEKPLTTNLLDAQEIYAHAHREVFMMHIWQYHPGILALADIANTKQLGDVLQIKTHRTNWTSPRYDTDTLWNFMSHDLSIFNTILGKLPEPTFATAEKHGDTIRDMIAIFAGNPICSTHISNRYERKNREVRLHCVDGVALLKNENDAHIEIIRGDDKSPAPHIEKHSISNTSALESELATFLAYLDGGPPPLCDLQHGLNVIATIDKLNTLASA